MEFLGAVAVAVLATPFLLTAAVAENVLLLVALRWVIRWFSD